MRMRYLLINILQLLFLVEKNFIRFSWRDYLNIGEPNEQRRGEFH